MAFLSRFFNTPARKALPTLDEILAARNIPMELPGLERLKDEFQHLHESEQGPWGDALQELVARGWPVPPLWQDAQYELSPRLVPTWAAERDVSSSGLTWKGSPCAWWSPARPCPRPGSPCGA